MLLGDSLTRIGESYLHLIINHIQLHIYPAASWGKLQSVRQQIAHNLLQFVAICPCHQLVFHTKAVQCQALFLGIKLEGITDVVQ